MTKTAESRSGATVSSPMPGIVHSVFRTVTSANKNIPPADNTSSDASVPSQARTVGIARSVTSRVIAVPTPQTPKKIASGNMAIPVLLCSNDLHWRRYQHRRWFATDEHEQAVQDCQRRRWVAGHLDVDWQQVADTSSAGEVRPKDAAR
jgi:hypothetical protein